MKDILLALKSQLETEITYASDSGYVAEDPYHLVELNKFPFFNIVPTAETIERVSGMSQKEIERHIYLLTIQFATRNMRKNIAVMGETSTTTKGILDFKDDIWDAILTDRTIGSTASGLIPGYTIRFDIIETDAEDAYFVAGGEMELAVYKDIPL